LWTYGAKRKGEGYWIYRERWSEYRIGDKVQKIFLEAFDEEENLEISDKEK
jgi:hypothetical protein